MLYGFRKKVQSMEQLKILITGDLSLTGIFEKKIRGNKEIFSDEIIDFLKSADYCICNLEGVVTDSVKSSDSKTILTNPSSTINYLAHRNIKVFNIANNHILDIGKQGLIDTLNELKGYIYFGAWLKNETINNTITIGNNIKVKLTSFTEKVKDGDKNCSVSTKKDLNILGKSECNWNIIFHHGGEEYTGYPSPTKRNLLKRIQIKNNPDFIISHHSHTLQGYEKINNTNIFYSLGNFIFDFHSHKFYNYTNESAILILTLFENSYTFDLVPIHINREKGIIELGSPEILTRFKQNSNFSDFNMKWRKEAYRTLLKRETPVNSEKCKKPLHKKNMFELLIDPQFYFKAFRIIFDNNNRSIYWNSFIYKLLYKNKND